ncbi:MAG: AAA domain-containing protein [Chloroflexi bacterium]|jgi:DNA polymerase III delta prime subunit|nr:AAA domain-containing protein [Chloroflexota bacterium]
MTHPDEKAFQEILEDFASFANSESYDNYERNYKVATLKKLGQVLTKEALDSPDFPQPLQKAINNELSVLNNLTHFITTDDFRKYLKRVSPDRLRDLLYDLLYGEADLAERINTFKREVDADYAELIEEGKHISLGLISILMAARFPEEYIMYRWSPLKEACELLGVNPPTGNNGVKYRRTMKFIRQVQPKLSEALGRDADLVDVHSLFWYGYSGSGYVKQGSKVREHEEDILSMEQLDLLLEITEKPRARNLVLYGPPGTGKTYCARRFAEEFLSNQQPDPEQISEFSEFVTFHQSFAYEEFVEGLRPRVNQDGGVSYEVQDGVFKRICKRAKDDPENNYLLVIDEVNRANIAKVFGELITLLEDDKRLGQEHEIQVKLPYSQDTFGVPRNLLIIGTMNTADRSIALLDLALRRRFTFVEFRPDPTLLGTVADINLETLLTRLNQRVAALMDRDHQIGHSYFLELKDIADLRFTWYHHVVPLLQEYFYNDGERLRAVLGTRFVREVEVDPSTQKALGELYEVEINRYEVVELDNDDFVAALQSLISQE